MPHFVVHCSQDTLTHALPEQILTSISDSARETELFNPQNIKARILPFEKEYYQVAGSRSDFVHVFAYIMEGRTTAQKEQLSQLIVANLKTLLPKIPLVSINVMDFEKSTYCNNAMV
jgi:5-carboxymethyl-2-hydroxymuconate isomerase